MDKSGEDFASRKEHNLSLITKLSEKMEIARGGGGGKYVERHESRGKGMARDRISQICDPGTPFLELSTLATYEMYDGRAHSAGIVTGIGAVHGKECIFVANDATVKGGSYYPMTVKKHVRAQEIAETNNLPCIYLVDSGGHFSHYKTKSFQTRDISVESLETKQYYQAREYHKLRCSRILYCRWSVYSSNERRVNNRQRQWYDISSWPASS